MGPLVRGRTLLFRAAFQYSDWLLAHPTTRRLSDGPDTAG